ncbi:adenylyl-sulfate kinase [Desulfovibrio sp. OttesenSCG-928-M14]|nr:adenylyl-sulfate kinase [Desulfovibrio sp. OttesenSCG-928-M14]
MIDKNPFLVSVRSRVTLEQRQAKNGHKGAVFWMTGLSGSGKSTIAHLVEEALFKRGVQVVVFDGDNIRTGLNVNLGFSDEDRYENVRRTAEMAKLFCRAGFVVICSLITPKKKLRELAQQIVGEDFFNEIFVDCPLEECERRDEKAFYAKARQGIIKNYTGLGSSYEAPTQASCRLCTLAVPAGQSAETLLHFIQERIRLPLEL